MKLGFKIKSQINNYLFIGLCLCLFISPSLYFATTKIELPIPSVLSNKGARFLEGGLTEVDPKDNASLDGFISKNFQEDIESFLGNQIPMKQNALLGFSSCQRFAIEISNHLFAWECYPSFYGSQKIFIPKYNALVLMPQKGSESILDSIRKFGAGVKSLSSDNPTVTFVIIIADMSDRSEANPAIRIVSSTNTTSDCIEALNEGIDGATSNVQSYSIVYDDPELYFKDYYTSDHHWNGYGALKNYSLMSEELKLRKIKAEGSDPNLIGAIQNGSNSRGGLQLIDEPLVEPCLAMANLSVKEPYGLPLSFNPIPLTRGNESLRVEFDFYHTWYGDAREIEIENPEETEKTLIVGDSFVSAMQWLIAANFQNTDVVLDCHGAATEAVPLQQRIDDEQYDYVFFVTHPTGLVNIANKFPSYFD